MTPNDTTPTPPASAPTEVTKEQKQRSPMHERRCGALWLDTSNKGEKYLNGKITIKGVSCRIFIFKNTKKDPSKQHPDYEIFVPEEEVDKLSDGIL